MQLYLPQTLNFYLVNDDQVPNLYVWTLHLNFS